ncbi:uncharacterized protein LOC109608412 [Aethina tumida]|uniref:uncharacterized protein LOC109608412 n=1 Tax=Aethina tumida TaxID=116153 RepID=UPI00096B6207|nr:uncharacterized protein LOC109608412 [Aethina tumida]
MDSHFGARLFVLTSCLALVCSIPASLVEEIKSSELRDSKVKRTPSNGEQNSEIQYFTKPSAAKRGANLKNANAEQQSLSDWTQDQVLTDSLSSIQSSLYNNPNQYDDKTVEEYEKGFQYGASKDKLDEALENAVLKSEYYGEPGAVNQYRFYGGDDRKRKRRSAKKLRLSQRLKRDVELTPEEILTLLNLYEKSRQNDNYRPWQNRLENSFDNFEDGELNDNDESWLETPVYPHVSRDNTDIGPQYMIDEPQLYDKRGKWGNFADNKKKRFMVAKKRNDPTRELRYINGPNQNDYYTLSRLLSNQQEPDLPLYRRLVL